MKNNNMRTWYLLLLHLHRVTNTKCRFFFLLWLCDPTRVMASSFLRFLDHRQRRTTVGRTPLDEWSARRRDLYLTTHNTHNRQTSMPPPRGIWTHDLSRRTAANLRLRPRGHWDRHQVSHRYSCFSWWWAHSCPKHVEKRNRHSKKNCVPSWLYLQDYTMDAQSTEHKILAFGKKWIYA